MARNEQEFLIELGQAIAAKRKSLALSQADLAYRLGMEVPNLSVIENGKSDLRILTLARICSALNCSLSEVLPSIANTAVFLDQQGKYQPLRRKSKGGE
jgi:transcriptional regulator with XRE-family HTH domain